MSIASSQVNSDAPKRYITTFSGDGSATTFTIAHNLNTSDIIVSAREISDSMREVFLDNYPDPDNPMNSLLISFDFAPTALQSYKLIIVG